MNRRMKWAGIPAVLVGIDLVALSVWFITVKASSDNRNFAVSFLCAIAALVLCAAGIWLAKFGNNLYTGKQENGNPVRRIAGCLFPASCVVTSVLIVVLSVKGFSDTGWILNVLLPSVIAVLVPVPVRIITKEK